MNHVTQKQHGFQGSIACPTICYSCLYFVTCIMVENPHKTFVWGQQMSPGENIQKKACLSYGNIC